MTTVNAEPPAASARGALAGSGRWLAPRNRRVLISAAILAVLIAVALLAPVIAPFSPTEQNIAMRLRPPGTATATGGVYLAGTDQYGRDVFSRLIYGVRIPLVVALSSALLGSLIGLAVGLPAGYLGGHIDAAVGVLIDIQLSMPFILVALMVIVLFGSSALNIILVFSFLSWPTTARVARASALRLRNTQFVEASRSAGATSLWILRKHILPNALPPVVVVATVQVANFVIYEAAFGFFGLGVPPPEPTWGNMLADARNYLRHAWWMSAFPGLCIAFVAVAANLFGDGLREALDPRRAGRAKE